LFAGLSAARRKRFFHPRGSAFEATVTFGTTRTLPFHGTRDAIARLSRGLGLPERAPDVLGLAFTLPELGQDFLLATSGDGPLTRHLLIPSPGYFRRPYSSVLPYDVGEEVVVFGARADAATRRLSDSDLATVERLVASDRVRFELTWAPVGSDDVQTFGTLELTGSHDGDVSFNPFNTYGSVHPAGALNRLRRETYASSQRARPDAEDVA
jgi:hypothetical protein